MSDAIPLPPRPSLEQYKNLARGFRNACDSGSVAAVQSWAAEWLASLARLLGPVGPVGPVEDESWIGCEARKVAQRFNQTRRHAPQCTLAQAQIFLARLHGFASWARFSRHLQALARAASADSQFEAAADAIIAGQLEALQALLHANPGLVRARSARQHRATLLHYVAANGVEDFRQKTPANIVAIARLLLDAGADVNAESLAYGGKATVLGLAATSCHPEAAGVQLALLELLMERGAIVDGRDVHACLNNGRGAAAEFFASRGAHLDLVGAAGVGRLEAVKLHFDAHGSLRPPATSKELDEAFAWACEFGRADVARFLLGHGIVVSGNPRHRGLHWAAYGGHPAIVKLLLELGAPVDSIEPTFQGTPLAWALYGWSGAGPSTREEHFCETVELLARAGARLDRTWFENGDAERGRAARKLRASSRMQAALRGAMPAPL